MIAAALQLVLSDVGLILPTFVVPDEPAGVVSVMAHEKVQVVLPQVVSGQQVRMVVARDCEQAQVMFEGNVRLLPTYDGRPKLGTRDYLTFVYNANDKEWSMVCLERGF